MHSFIYAKVFLISMAHKKTKCNCKNNMVSAQKMTGKVPDFQKNFNKLTKL